jgi:ABC-type transport system involved in Fe-S cluster assembly fused permease/ATPase subunit
MWLTVFPFIPETMFVAALRDADTWKFVEHLPESIDTRVGEKGARLDPQSARIDSEQRNAATRSVS